MDEALKTNVLYFGDNLEILRNRDYFPNECIDLIYLDPPFNSKKDYNILFKENGGVESEAQIKAFTDTWHWTQTAENTYHDIVINGPLKIGKLIGALHDTIGCNDVMAYLVMMTARLIELHRVLKPTGSLYLHCDPTASHYLKLVLDQIFGANNFRNEIIWRYRRWPAKQKAFQRMHDVILCYIKARGGPHRWNQLYEELSPSSIRQWKGKLRVDVTSEEGTRHSEIGEKVSPGVPMSDVWEISQITAPYKEYLGYETQKPLALLERIIKASSNEGDTVLDPFCGCGTAVVAAQKLNRRWIGIDITHVAVALMRNRLKDSFNIDAEVIGEPVDLAGAKALAYQDRYQFQWWALSLIRARPLGEKKKGADKGIDGVIHFIDEVSGTPKRVVVQVKSGHVGVNAIRELKAVAANNAIGVLITLESPTGPMRVEAVDAGFYHSPIWNKDYSKIQIFTIEDLLKGKTVDMPPQTQTSVTFAKAPKISKKEGKQLLMD
ncbi:MAG: restriction endonuclease [Dehalococcoidales bacterium]|nr:restriction endonuclease [Dehalococcoidales bacterium]